MTVNGIGLLLILSGGYDRWKAKMVFSPLLFICVDRERKESKKRVELTTLGMALMKESCCLAAFLTSQDKSTASA